MKILYGINATVNGHITKSCHLINAIEAKHHQVDILISGKNTNIKIEKPVKFDFKGFTFEYKSGSIDLVKTFRNLDIISFFKDIKINLDTYDYIITDFEPVSAWAAKLSNKKSFGISHQYSFFSDKVPLPKKKSPISQFFIKNYAPVHTPIGLHFETYDNSIFLPIVRNEILKGNNKNTGHVTIYLPGYSAEYLVNFFSKFDREIHIFSNISTCNKTEKIKCFKISNDAFTKSLLECDTIITGAGFETPSEALYLGKKLISIPLKNQWEQLANAAALNKLGVRIEYELQNIKDLNCSIINWHWKDPTQDILMSMGI